MPKNTCPDCKGEKDIRAKRCNACRMRSTDHPRLGKGKDWHVHDGTGYVAKCVKGEWVYRHRYVMEKHIGRTLRSHEHVHHIDGNKRNNKLNNLMVLQSSEHHRRHMTPQRAKEMSRLGHKARWGYVSDI